MRSPECRRHRVLDNVSDNEHIEKRFREKMENAGSLEFDEQDKNNIESLFKKVMEFHEAFFYESDVGKETINVSTQEKQQCKKYIEEGFNNLMNRVQQDYDDLLKRANQLKSMKMVEIGSISRDYWTSEYQRERILAKEKQRKNIIQMIYLKIKK